MCIHKSPHLLKNKELLHNNNVSSSEMMQGGSHRFAAHQSDFGLSGWSCFLLNAAVEILSCDK